MISAAESFIRYSAIKIQFDKEGHKKGDLNIYFFCE